MIQLDPHSRPHEIEERSFAIIDAEVLEPRAYTGALWEIARRMIHTTGDISLLKDIILSEAALEAGLVALRSGCIVYTDTRMALCGMEGRLTRLGVKTQCILQSESVAQQAQAQGITRSRAGILEIGENLAGNIVAIGNAPTALLALLEVLEAGVSPPALIVGMPVGFVNAAESKELLLQSPYKHMTIRGRKGGSPLVASVLNALAGFVR